jgi:hypothetical protein
MLLAPAERLRTIVSPFKRPLQEVSKVIVVFDDRVFCPSCLQDGAGTLAGSFDFRESRTNPRGNRNDKHGHQEQILGYHEHAKNVFTGILSLFALACSF